MSPLPVLTFCMSPQTTGSPRCGPACTLGVYIQMYTSTSPMKSWAGLRCGSRASGGVPSPFQPQQKRNKLLEVKLECYFCVIHTFSLNDMVILSPGIHWKVVGNLCSFDPLLPASVMCHPHPPVIPGSTCWSATSSAEKAINVIALHFTRCNYKGHLCLCKTLAWDLQHEKEGSFYRACFIELHTGFPKVYTVIPPWIATTSSTAALVKSGLSTGMVLLRWIKQYIFHHLLPKI